MPFALYPMNFIKMKQCHRSEDSLKNEKHQFYTSAGKKKKKVVFNFSCVCVSGSSSKVGRNASTSFAPIPCCLLTTQ